MSLFQVIKIY